MKIIHGTQDYINGFKAGYARGCEDVTFSIINHVVMGRDNEDICIDIMNDFIESANRFEAKVIEKNKPKRPTKKNGIDICQVCGREVFHEYNFCPGCGYEIERKGYDWNSCSGEMTGSD